MKRLIGWLFFPPVSAPRSTMLIRLMAGGVFLWEGILKFVYSNQGVGRFTKLGIPFPGPTAHFVAILEIVGGLLLMSGFLTRAIAIPFVIEMIVAILSTKISLYLGNIASATSARAASGRPLGRAARDPLGLRADHERAIPPGCGPGPLVRRRHPRSRPPARRTTRRAACPSRGVCSWRKVDPGTEITLEQRKTKPHSPPPSRLGRLVRPIFFQRSARSDPAFKTVLACCSLVELVGSAPKQSTRGSDRPRIS